MRDSDRGERAAAAVQKAIAAVARRYVGRLVDEKKEAVVREELAHEVEGNLLLDGGFDARERHLVAATAAHLVGMTFGGRPS